jgi:uncharacterized alkaline shock family protein YloU
VDPEAFVLADGEQGRVAITRDAVVEIVGRATAESYGVVGLAGTGRMSRLVPWGIRKGVDVRRGPDGLEVEVRVVVEHGLKLAEVSDAVRARVSYELERMVGLPLSSLEVRIERVRGS